MSAQVKRFVMDPADRAWLEMDEPGNPMVISAIFQLEGPVDAADFQKAIVERLLRYPRFGQKVEGSGAGARWMDDESLDFAYHVRVVRLGSRAGEAQLKRAISKEVSQDLDRSRPLWRLTLFPHPGGAFTVLFRIHHALADGIALVTLLMDSTDGGIRRSGGSETRVGSKRAHAGPLESLIDQLEAINQGLVRLVDLARDVPSPARLLRSLKKGRQTLGAMQRVLHLPDSKPAMFRNALSGHRNVAWISGVPFTPVKALARKLDARINDIFLAALAGAIRKELSLSECDLAADQMLRVSIPVNLRSGKGRRMGNQFGLVFLDMPVGMKRPADRLRTVSEGMARLKNSLEARMTYWGLSAASYLPVPLERRLITAVGAKSAGVVSNLPGPKQAVRIAGARMKNLVFWPPQAGGMGLGISFFTYAGELSVGVSADRNILPRPERLVNSFMEELSALGAIDPELYKSGAGRQAAIVGEQLVAALQ